MAFRPLDIRREAFYCDQMHIFIDLLAIRDFRYQSEYAENMQ